MLSNQLAPNDLIGGGIARHVTHSPYFDFARYRYFDLPQYKYSHVSVSDAPRGHLTDIAVPIQTINA